MKLLPCICMIVCITLQPHDWLKDGIDCERIGV